MAERDGEITLFTVEYSIPASPLARGGTFDLRYWGVPLIGSATSIGVIVGWQFNPFSNLLIPTLTGGSTCLVMGLCCLYLATRERLTASSVYFDGKRVLLKEIRDVVVDSLMMTHSDGISRFKQSHVLFVLSDGREVSMAVQGGRLAQRIAEAVNLERAALGYLRPTRTTALP
jgi:hypothetical protein